ncbi:MAG: hypothetical protein QNK37_08520 [Acidobacteriota bacterium]|nr:hypothetical protein [Acidobacteriota bacterium]
MYKLTFISLVFVSLPCFCQNRWKEKEIENILSLEITEALEILEEKGITPYNFGRDLLDSGRGEQAKKWYRNLGIKTKEYKYLFGLAWAKWHTGDSAGAFRDAYYLLDKDISKITRARTYYMLGHLYYAERKIQESKKNLERSRDLYAKLNKDGGSFFVSV